MARTRNDALTQAESLYDTSLTPETSREIEALLKKADVDGRSAAERSSYLAIVTACEYLNRWNRAGPSDLDKVETDIKDALALTPDLALAHYAQGFLHRIKGQHEQALAAFSESVRLDPNFFRGYAQKGNELLYLGQPDKALPEVEKAIELAQRSYTRGMFFWIMGRIHFFKGEYPSAIPWLQKSIRLWPTLWYSRLYLVSAYAHSRKLASARRALRAFDARFPGYTIARVIRNEQRSPDADPFFVEGREQFHEGLRLAGMPLA